MNILNRLLKKSQGQIHPLLNKAYPISGIFYHTDKGIFYIKSGKRYKVFSDTCFRSWGSQAIDTSFENLSHIPYGGILGFRDGTIIHNLADGKIYVVSDGKRLHLKTPYVYPKGWIEANKIIVSDQEVNLHKDGPEINAS